MHTVQQPAQIAGVNPFQHLPSSAQGYCMPRLNAQAQPAKPARKNSRTQAAAANPRPQKRTTGGRRKASEPPPMPSQQPTQVQQQQRIYQPPNQLINPSATAYVPPHISNYSYQQQIPMGNPPWNTSALPSQSHPPQMYQHYTPSSQSTQNLAMLNTSPHILALQYQMYAASQRHPIPPNVPQQAPAYPAHMSNPLGQATINPRLTDLVQTPQNLGNSVETSRVQLGNLHSRTAREASSRRPEVIKASAVREAMSGHPGEQVATAQSQDLAQRQAAWHQFQQCERMKCNLQVYEQERSRRRNEMNKQVTANIPVTQAQRDMDMQLTSEIEKLKQEVKRQEQLAAQQHLNRTAMAATQQQVQPPSQARETVLWQAGNQRRGQNSTSVSGVPIPTSRNQNQEYQRVATVASNPEEQSTRVAGLCQRCCKITEEQCPGCKSVWYCNATCQQMPLKVLYLNHFVKNEVRTTVPEASSS
ncbi:hypothetical protein B566_EDAN011013 [Ephemera danica]|nr:hypothetical protein B566_EDAN011013 [Ephemera danica]